MNVALTPSTATIDAGRMLTLERRRRFATLELHLSDLEQDPVRIIDCSAGAGVLSERRIARALRAFDGWYPSDTCEIGATAGRIAAKVHQMMKMWADDDYRDVDTNVVDRWYDTSAAIRVELRHI